MPPRSAVSMLPPEILAELNKRLCENQFSDYVKLSEWLKEQGFQISKSSVHRHGREFQKQLEQIKKTTLQAKAIIDEVGDDQQVLAEAITRLVQQKAFEILSECDFNTEETSLTDLGRMIATVNKSGIDLKKYQQQVKERCLAAAEEVKEELKKEAGLSPEVEAKIRAKILGIV